MTTTPLPLEPSGRSTAHVLGGPELRRGLEVHLRRRVPSQDVEDVAQSVLAAAVASPSTPTDPAELRRWLAAITRNKVADFHRQRARRNAMLAEGASPEDLAASPDAVEERDVLRVLLGEASSAREADTLDWLVREHTGERLADIASEKGVPAALVRKRVSRLRHALRSRWAALFGVAAVLGAVLAFAVTDGEPAEAIAPDRTSSAEAPKVPAAATDAIAKRAEGEWIVRAVRPTARLTPFQRELVEKEAMEAKLVVHGNRIDLESRSGAFKTSWKIGRAKTTATTAHLVLVNETGATSSADVVLGHDEGGDRLDITLHDTRYGGAITLRRPAP